MTELIVVGIGGFGREAVSVALACQRAGTLPYDSIAAVDDNPTAENLARLERMGVPFRGSSEEGLLGADSHFVVGVGAPVTRARIVEKLDTYGLEAATLIHPTAVVGEDCRVGAGTIICAGVQVTVNVELGQHVHLNLSCTVGHDSRLNDFVSVNPGAAISGDVEIGARTLVGVGAVILQGLHIGVDTVVGGAACVVKNVPDGVTVKGIPAR